jgi:adenylate cyclase class IV
VEKAIPEYLRFRNESKGQWARYGQTASSALKEAEAKPLTNEELEKVIRELYFEKEQRVIKPDGKFKFEGKRYHLSEKLAGKIIEVRTTLKGIEVWYEGLFIKRWKYWEYIINNAVDYMLEKYLV